MVELQGNGFEVDGVKFTIWLPKITEEALAIAKAQEEAKEEGNAN